MKKKRALYNLVVGIGSKVLLMVIGFLIPKVLIENYGSDVNGLLSSMAQIFGYLNLAEAGIGVATTQALYKAVATDDWDEINSILNAASKFYKRTGVVYLIGVICVAVLYPLLIPNTLGFYRVFLIFVFSGLEHVLQYFFLLKYVALLNTEGKTYIHVAISTIVSSVTQITKLILVSNAVNLVFIYAAYFVISIAQVVAVNVYIRKNYSKSINTRVPANTDALSQHNSVLVHQISSLVFSNTDVLILTAFTNLQCVSIYTIYNMVVANISVLITTALDSFTSALGLTYNQNRGRFDKYYDVYEVVSWGIYFSMMTVTLVLYEPFIRLYMAKADISYTDTWLPLLFVINTLLSIVRMPGLKVMNIEGCFKDTKSRTILESVINLSVSMVAVQILGIYGVLLGTTAALLFRTFDIIIYSNAKILHRSWSIIIKRLVAYSVGMLFMVYIFSGVRSWIDSVERFILCGGIITLISGIGYCLIISVIEIRNESFREMASTFLERIMHVRRAK